MYTHIDLSIIIVNWNTRELLLRCLASIHGAIQAFPPGKVETIVVDNASTDGSTEMIERCFTWVSVIANQENIGFARANNQALRQASGQYLLLLNSDTEVTPTALWTLVTLLEIHPEVGATGPKVLNPDGSLQNSYGSLPTVLDEIVGPYWADFLVKPWGGIGRRLWGRRINSGIPHAVDRVSFACTLIRRAALDQVGLLDEDFEFYSEDYDMFKRLKDANWATLFCPTAVIMHHWGASSRQRNDWSLRMLYRSKRLYFAKHQGLPSEAVLRLGLTVRFALKWLMGAAKHLYNKPAATHQMALYQRLIQDMLQRVAL